MKYCITLCVIAAAFCFVQNQAKITVEQKEILKQKSAECIAETKIDPKFIQKAIKGETDNHDEFKAYAICLTKRLQLLNDAGEINMEKALSLLLTDEDKARAKKALESCQLIKKDRLNETQFLRALCIYKVLNGLL